MWCEAHPLNQGRGGNVAIRFKPLTGEACKIFENIIALKTVSDNTVKYEKDSVDGVKFSGPDMKVSHHTMDAMTQKTIKLYLDSHPGNLLNAVTENGGGNIFITLMNKMAPPQDLDNN